MTLEFGLDTFGDVMRNADGSPRTHAEVIRDTVAEAVLADELGIDYFGLGEHHRPDFAISAPEPIIASILARTERIKVGTSVTVLSSDDPIRLYERFATLDALAPGRAEITIGRGSFTESFPLFGFALDDYETLFQEKSQLLHLLLSEEKINASGKHIPDLRGVTVYPRPETPLTVWRGVGGSPQSVVEAAAMGMPLMLAIIGGDPARFKPIVDLFHRAHGQMGTTPGALGVHSPGHVGESDQAAKDEFFSGYAEMHSRIGRERGWPPLQREAFEGEIAHGSLYVGGVESVAQKIAATVKTLGLSRFTLKHSAGPQLPEVQRKGIELYGREVIPRVRELLAA